MATHCEISKTAFDIQIGNFAAKSLHICLKCSLLNTFHVFLYHLTANKIYELPICRGKNDQFCLKIALVLDGLMITSYFTLCFPNYNQGFLARQNLETIFGYEI